MANDNVLEQIRAQIKTQVQALSPEQIKAQLAKFQEQKAKQIQRNATPEAKAKRTEYNQKRNQDPAVVAARKAYHQRPEVKARMTDYRKERNAKIKALVDRAKELGLVDEKGNPIAQTA